MDFFDFLILAALALPVIFRWLGDQSKKGQQPTPVETDFPAEESPTDRETEFERALREISRALGGDVAEPEPAARTSSERASVEQRTSTRESQAFELEDTFEERGSERLKKVSAEPFRRLKLRRIEAPAVEAPVRGRSAAASHVRDSLRRSGSARNAILFSEVLRPPLSLRDPDDL